MTISHTTRDASSVGDAEWFGRRRPESRDGWRFRIMEAKAVTADTIELLWHGTRANDDALIVFRQRHTEPGLKMVSGTTLAILSSGYAVAYGGTEFDFPSPTLATEEMSRPLRSASV